MSKQSKKRYFDNIKTRNEENAKKRKYLAQMASIKEYNVVKEEELLEFLLHTFENKPRNTVKSILTKKCVAVNGLVCSQYNYKLYRGDVVMVAPKPIVGLEKMAKKV